MSHTGDCHASGCGPLALNEGRSRLNLFERMHVGPISLGPDNSHEMREFLEHEAFERTIALGLMSFERDRADRDRQGVRRLEAEHSPFRG